MRFTANPIPTAPSNIFNYLRLPHLLLHTAGFALPGQRERGIDTQSSGRARVPKLRQSRGFCVFRRAWL